LRNISLQPGFELPGTFLPSRGERLK